MLWSQRYQQIQERWKSKRQGRRRRRRQSERKHPNQSRTDKNSQKNKKKMPRNRKITTTKYLLRILLFLLKYSLESIILCFVFNIVFRDLNFGKKMETKINSKTTFCLFILPSSIYLIHYFTLNLIISIFLYNHHQNMIKTKQFRDLIILNEFFPIFS